jgi:hypothetical protein
MTNLARDLRAWRYQFYLPQWKAAQVCSVSLRTYQRYESGAHVPPYRDIQRLNALMDAYYHGRQIGMDVGRPL